MNACTSYIHYKGAFKNVSTSLIRRKQYVLKYGVTCFMAFLYNFWKSHVCCYKRLKRLQEGGIT